MSGESGIPHYTRLIAIPILFTALALFAVTAVLSGCGNSPNGDVDSSAQQREEAMNQSLQGFENQLGFELSEPLYSMLTAEVLKVEDAQPYKLVLVEVKDSQYPAGLESNPYVEEEIKPGTLLVIEWNSETPVEAGRTFMIPAECIKAVNGIRITIKGTAREVQETGLE
ncbi:MAG: hypothetical protein C4575_09160 [Desulforudis sp.]|jgi:hypothetical protein|nr:MAG: hypothetical protein C4575_09160 [Desulforudis sp.]